VLVWLGLAYCTGPVDAHGYQKTAVRSAQEALNAVRTAAVTVDAWQRGGLLDPYASTLLDDELSRVASAHQQLLGEAPPDAGARTIRGQLLPLLDAAATGLGDLVAAMSTMDDAAIRAGQTRLRELGERLDDFVERYR
jgi:hypothetical protein